MRQPSLPGDILAHYYGHDGHLGHVTCTVEEIFLASTRISYIRFPIGQSFKELGMFLKYTDRCLFFPSPDLRRAAVSYWQKLCALSTG